MLENDHATQDGFGESSGQTCPNGHDIQSIERRGVAAGEVRAQPCGCNLTDVRARNFPSGQDERVATDGGAVDEEYWARNFAAYLDEYTNLDGDDVTTDVDGELEAAAIPAAEFTRAEVAELSHELSNAGFVVYSTTTDDQIVVGDGPELNVPYADEDAGGNEVSA